MTYPVVFLRFDLKSLKNSQFLQTSRRKFEEFAATNIHQNSYFLNLKRNSSFRSVRFLICSSTLRIQNFSNVNGAYILISLDKSSSFVPVKEYFKFMVPLCSLTLTSIYTARFKYVHSLLLFRSRDWMHSFA